MRYSFFVRSFALLHTKEWSVTISILITACNLKAGKAGTSGEDQVKLLRSRLGLVRQLVGFSVASIKDVL